MHGEGDGWKSLHDGIEESLGGRKVGSSTSCYGSSQISELRIFISISRFIPLLMSFDSIPKPQPHLVKLVYNPAIVSLVSHLSHHRNVWHMQDAQLHKSKLEPQDHPRAQVMSSDWRRVRQLNGVSINTPKSYQKALPVVSLDYRSVCDTPWSVR